MTVVDKLEQPAEIATHGQHEDVEETCALVFNPGTAKGVFHANLVAFRKALSHHVLSGRSHTSNKEQQIILRKLLSTRTRLSTEQGS
jgi:hypothetical protein